MAQCINPSEIQEGDWSAYLHGDASPDVVQHVAHCTFCASQIEEMRMVDAQLLVAFYRDECPTPEVLADYVLGNLAAAERLRIAAHERGCAACRAEVAPLRSLRTTAQEATDEPPSLLTSLWESLTLALVARPVPPAAVPVRGAGWQGRFEADDLVITLSSLNGGLTGRVRRRQASVDVDYRGQAWLLSQGIDKGPPKNSEIDERGRFRFTQVVAGDYALLLQIGEQDVALESLRIE